jgi:hypothetical protein
LSRYSGSVTAAIRLVSSVERQATYQHRQLSYHRQLPIGRAGNA